MIHDHHQIRHRDCLHLGVGDVDEGDADLPLHLPQTRAHLYAKEFVERGKTRIIESLENSQTRCVIYNPVMYPEFPAFHVLFPELSRTLQTDYKTAAKLRGGGETWLGMIRRGVEKRDPVGANP